MHILWVAPLKARTQLHTLTYYSADNIPVGAVIDVPVRNSTTPGLVVHREEVVDVKAFLRTAGFSAKKVSVSDEPSVCVSPPVLLAARYTAQYHASTVGAVLRNCVPSAILQKPQPIIAHTPKTAYEEHRALQAPLNERLQEYKTIIRETFATGSSVLLVCATNREALHVHNTLAKGIGEKVHLLISNHSAAEQQKRWQAAQRAEGPILICATSSFTSMPRADIGLYIIERESARGYKRLQRPYIDMRIFIQALAREQGSTVLYADSFLRLQTHALLQEGVVVPHVPISRRTTHTSNVRVVDMSAALTALREENPRAEFPVFAEDVVEHIRAGLQKKHHIFVLASRRGFAGTTVCNDCGTLVRCTRCELPVALHTKEGTRVFLCHRCGESRTAKERCKTCTSWNIVALGRGIERLEAAIKKEVPAKQVFRIDTDNSTPAKAEQAVATWQQGGGVLIGTELALPYIGSVHTSICASLDSLLSIPDFAIDERIFGLLSFLQERTKQTVYVQTQQPHTPVLQHAESGNTASFVRNELTLRKQLHYPPYAIIIKCTCVGTKTTVTKEMQKFAVALARHKPRVFGTFVREKNGVALSALLRVKTGAWPKKDIVEALRALAPCWRIEVQPDRAEG